MQALQAPNASLLSADYSQFRNSPSFENILDYEKSLFRLDVMREILFCRVTHGGLSERGTTRSLKIFPTEKSFIVTLENNDWLTDPAGVKWEEAKSGNGMGDWRGALSRIFYVKGTKLYLNKCLASWTELNRNQEIGYCSLHLCPWLKAGLFDIFILLHIWQNCVCFSDFLAFNPGHIFPRCCLNFYPVDGLFYVNRSDQPSRMIFLELLYLN